MHHDLSYVLITNNVQIFFIYIISLYMFRTIRLIFRRSHYCINAKYGIITLKTSEWSIIDHSLVYNNVSS